ncbi:MAG: Ig-like domain-containing protein [Gammaproteobacteria bacterium]|nr:Ig-like domain-containing protein [Gammaproteobacteria bacterium]
MYPILENNCAGCHSNNSAVEIELANFAHSQVVLAHAVVINRDLVNRENPQLSRFVERLVDDKHFCWTSCSEDANTIANAIGRWNDLLANTGGGGGGTVVSPQDSVSAFAQSLHPVVVQWCGTCHDGVTTAFSGFANTDAETAHEITLTRALVNFNSPADSELVTYLSELEHNCCSNCADNAARMQSAIVEWIDLMAAAGNNNGNNRPPIAVNDLYNTLSNVPVTTGNVLLNDSDVDNDTLGIASYSALSSRGGSIVNNLNGTFTYTPPFGISGADSFTYTITDGRGGSDDAVVTINVILNNGPVATNDSVKANQNTPLVITTLLANDTSSSANVLTIVSTDTLSQNGGRVLLGAGNSVTYTPPTDFTGIDRFIYTVTDGVGTATAQVEVDVNAQPVAVSDAVYTYVNITANTGSVLINDRDTNGDTLTVSSFDISSVQAGSVSYNGDGTFTYVPPDNFEGNDSFDYIVSDGRGGAATATVFIAVTQPVLRDDNRFLAFLNQTSPLFDEDANSARAYYAAIDPANQCTTLDAWRNVNGFNIGADAFAVYINNNDLGFARRMFVRTDPITGVVASYVENFATLADALNQVNLIATVAMEYTVAPGQDPLDPDARHYTTFYVFNGNGNRDLGADLDGRGFKFVPGLCNICHGGRPKALVNGAYPDAGETGGGFIPWDLDTYLFADATASVSRADQENQFKIFNRTVLSTNPGAAQRQVVEGWYGGSGLPANTFNGGFVPPGWSFPDAPANATQLYLQVVAPSCRACHVMRGSPQQSDIDFSTYAKFISYKPRIEHLVYDEGTMPLALRTFDRFWNNINIPETLAIYLNSSKILEDDELLTPGRSLANPGPFREAAIGRINLNGNGSLFTGGNIAFNWTLVSRPAQSTAILQNVNQANAFFVADVPGDYVAQLVVNDGIAETPPSPPGEVIIRVSPAVRPVSFVSDVSPVFEQCAVCHLGFDNPRFNNLGTLYDNVINFVNLDDPVNSLILTKPSGNHHNGGTIPGFETKASDKYNLILRWILEGAPDN